MKIEIIHLKIMQWQRSVFTTEWEKWNCEQSNAVSSNMFNQELNRSWTCKAGQIISLDFVNETPAGLESQ